MLFDRVNFHDNVTHEMHKLPDSEKEKITLIFFVKFNKFLTKEYRHREYDQCSFPSEHTIRKKNTLLITKY